MTDNLITDLEAIKVHITGSDVPQTQHRVRTIHTTFTTATVANTVVDGRPRMLLAHTPNRTRASLAISGTAGDTIILAGSAGEAQSGHGATVGPMSAPIVLEGGDEVWLGAGVGASIVVGIVAEYADHR